MLRPNPEQTLFGYIPIRLIASILLVFAIVISIILVLGIEREKNLIAELTKEDRASQPSDFFFLKTQRDLVQVGGILFLLTAVGVSAIITYQNCHSTRKTLENVKSFTRNILGSIPTGVITVDSQGRITSFNPAAERTLSLEESVLGKRLRETLPATTDLGRFLDEALTEGVPFQDQNITYPKGEQILMLRVTISDLKNEKDRTEGLVLLVKDISELARLEQQLRRSEKLSAINTLSAAVAHEIRNPLSAMDLNLGLLEEEILLERGSAQAIREYFDVLNVEIKRLKGILDHFARFSKPTELVLGTVRLEPVLHHLVSLIRGEAQEKGIAIELNLSPDLPAFVADENQITQVFLNMMINAIQAMTEGGKLRIQVLERKVDAQRWIDVTFSDTGKGIEKENIHKIFEPFFSTRPGGTGLGLAVAHRIVEDHGGAIHVESAEGRGSIFTVQLPVSGQKEVKA